MTREFIEQLDVVEPNCYETDREEKWYKVGLVNGLKIADENPINLWHDASEEPEDKEDYILYYSEYYNNWFIYPLAYLIYCCYNSWGEAVEKESIKQWAYLKDILPKGGEKC